jgi:RND family efflux transporter MFP subunit
MRLTVFKNIGCAVALASAVVLAGCQQDGAAAKAELGATKPGSDPVAKEDVATTVAVQVKLPQTVMLTGSLAADEQSDVAAKRGGIVNKVLIDRGSVLKEGDVMVQLDTTDATNSLQQAEAAAQELMVRLGLTSADEKFDPQKQPDVKVAKTMLELAEKSYQRDRKLFESKVISPEEYDKTRNDYIAAQQKYELSVAQAAQLYQQFQTTLTRVKSARQLVTDMTVKAPFDGAVVEKFVAPGEALMDGAKVANLVRINPLRLVLNVPEQAVGKMDQGQAVQFTVDAFPGERFEGVVKNIAPALNAETRTLTVEAMVDNPDRLLRPGLFATAEVQLDADRMGVRVPASALRRREDVAQVFVVDEGIARATMVVPGETRKGLVEIVAGLKGGEQIVSNAAEVEDGIRIQ